MHQTLENLIEQDIDYGEDEIRLKLQELEQALLYDINEDLLDPDEFMGVGDDRAEPIKNLLLADSPKESS